MRAKHSERGAGLIETVMIMGVLMSLMFGIVDFGRALYTYSFVAQMAREGARWAIVRGSNCTVLDHCNAQTADLQTYVRSLGEGATTNNSVVATLAWPSCSAGAAPGHAANAPGCIANVTVTYPFKFIAPFMPGSIQMTSTSQMVVSN